MSCEPSFRACSTNDRFLADFLSLAFIENTRQISQCFQPIFQRMIRLKDLKIQKIESQAQAASVRQFLVHSDLGELKLKENCICFFGENYQNIAGVYT